MRTILSTTAASSACIVSQNKKDTRQRAADSTHVRQGELTPYIFYLGSLYEGTGASLQEKRAGAQAPVLYALSVLFVFLCLAALYESWRIPFAVILAAGLGVLGALCATALRGLDNDVFFQVGLLTTVGLAAKNAILIVEFAMQLVQQGRTVFQAALEAAKLRLRPIIMTSLAFGLGVLPLALGTGAGAGGRIAVGTAVLGGTAASTVLGLLFVPLFFVWIARKGQGGGEGRT